MAQKKVDKFATEKGTATHTVKKERDFRQRQMCKSMEMGYDQSTGRCKKRR
jgi:hypothetical protein